MTATSRHLGALADHAQAGAHVVLRGQVGDEVLVEGEIRAELWAIGRELNRNAGIETVVVVSQARGLYCVDGEDRRVEEVLQEINASDLSAVEGANFKASTPFLIANTIRTLLRQQRISVAVILRDPDVLSEGENPDDPRAPGVLLEAMAEAGFRGNGGEGPPVQNMLIVYGNPGHQVADLVAQVPGVVELNVDLPDRAERAAALRDLTPGFFGAIAEKPSDDDLDALARITHGYTLRGLNQMSRRSHAVRKPISRPETLFREARREQLGTPINRVGVGAIMSMLEDEIVGQEQAMEAIQELLERGRWRSANRPPGSLVTRPMATMVLHGPTGVGKTETGYILADAIAGSRNAVRRIDCAEFQQEHDTARLTGAPPGYVGYEDGGALSDALEADAAIIVLDEFDRGGPRLAEMLLGILDAGRLTDGRGRTFGFENAVLILTTNAGSGRSEDEDDDNAKASVNEPVAVGATAAVGGRASGNGSGVLLSSEELLARSAAILKSRLEEPAKTGGLGSPALWSRLQDSLVGYDYLRRPALKAMIEKSCRHLGANLGDEFGLDVRFAVDHFASVIADRLPPDGEWDGRKISPLVNVILERPARERLGQGGFDLGEEVTFVPDEAGRASLP
ncbi:MAG TPA: AAA family ATPase [Solirubrobacterales bacterium]|jgi:DNA polymerase III delta prime subunit|nr:AAA family ATPase [Solirubrobacterales bacterium]